MLAARSPVGLIPGRQPLSPGGRRSPSRSVRVVSSVHLGLAGATSVLTAAQLSYNKYAKNGTLTIRSTLDLLNSKELCDGFKALTNVDPQPPKSESELRPLFDKADVNKDGRLTKSDFLLLYLSLKSRLVTSNPLVLAEACLGFIDTDRNGKIEGGELKALLGMLGIPGAGLLPLPDTMSIDYRSVLKSLGADLTTDASAGRSDTPGGDWSSAVCGIVALQAALFTAYALGWLPDLVMGLNGKMLTAVPPTHQILSTGLISSSWAHLAETTLLTYALGRRIERAYGGAALWLLYLSSILEANVAAVAIMPARMAVGSAAEPFATSAGGVGLFVVGVWLPRALLQPLEVLCVAPFMVTTFLQHAAPLAPALVLKFGTDSYKVGHVAHLGAVVGVGVAFWAVSMLVSVAAQAWEQRRTKAA
ncbi:hypothetical protein FOA52_001529 [Chlamydomonas sp. UWO 241]|nr:hypothetical protein FOA52_001529 [Chlamydomonas sp. UWO 241]